MEYLFKAYFPATNEDTLAGSLSNTIPGRICNFFDLGGGGFTVDGACCSSLLAVATACNQLMTEQVDVALAGGVDISLDTFELIGSVSVILLLQHLAHDFLSQLCQGRSSIA